MNKGTMPATKRPRRGATIAKKTQTVTEDRVFAAQRTSEPFWGWSDLALFATGMLLLIVALYQIVLHFGLTAAAAGAITDVPGPLGILYVVLRLRYKRTPWAALGWVPPRRRLDWLIAVGGGAALGLFVMAIENPTRFQIHFHTTAEFLVFGVVFAGLVEETIWRGAVLPVVLRHTKPFIAALLTAIVFALYHGVYRGRVPPLSALLSITLMGTMYGLLRIRSESTLTAALMHGCYNLTLFFWQGA